MALAKVTMGKDLLNLISIIFLLVNSPVTCRHIHKTKDVPFFANLGNYIAGARENGDYAGTAHKNSGSFSNSYSELLNSSFSKKGLFGRVMSESCEEVLSHLKSYKVQCDRLRLPFELPGDLFICSLRLAMSFFGEVRHNFRDGRDSALPFDYDDTAYRQNIFSGQITVQMEEKIQFFHVYRTMANN